MTDASSGGERAPGRSMRRCRIRLGCGTCRLGGKDNFAADRALGDQIVQVFPDIVDIARESRRFLTRAVRHLAKDGGIRQFLDIGTGLPTADNTHEVAQRINPHARIVYVDNDQDHQQRMADPSQPARVRHLSQPRGQR